MYTLRYIKVTTLSGVSYVSVYEQTHSRQTPLYKSDYYYYYYYYYSLVC